MRARKGSWNSRPDRCRDQHHVEYDGCKCRYAKPPVGIQYTPGKRGEGNEEQVGECKAQHERRKVEIASVADKAGRNDQHESRRADDAE